MNFKLADPGGKSMVVCRRCLWHIAVDSFDDLEVVGVGGGSLVWMMSMVDEPCEPCSAATEEQGKALADAAKGLAVN